MIFIKRCFSTNSKLLFRNYNKESKTFNPGVNRRIKLFKEEQHAKNKIVFNEEAIDSLEEDIYYSQNLDDMHKRELNSIESKIRLKQVERKYFTTHKLPNMLFWAEKEQIRLLSQSDPEKWTPQKLSKSFPATIDIIKKIIKSQWKPANKERVKSHDKKVSENWLTFAKGQLKFPDNFASHLRLFTSREEIVFKPDENLPENSEPTKGEFSAIIRNYNSIERYSENQDSTNPISKNGLSVSEKKLYSRLKKKEYTLESLRESIRDSELNNSLSKEFKMESKSSNAIRGVLNDNMKNNLQDREDIIQIESSVYEIGGTCTKDDDIAMIINIPKEKWKKGCLYKVNNCYYTDDGEFLYRV